MPMEGRLEAKHPDAQYISLERIGARTLGNNKWQSQANGPADLQQQIINGVQKQ